MTSPLVGSLATQIYKGMKGLFLDAVLTVDVAGISTDAADPVAPTQATYPCKAIQDTYGAYDMANDLAAMGDSKILILAKSLPVAPTNQNRITIQNKTFTILKVDVDPATALYTCQGRA